MQLPLTVHANAAAFVTRSKQGYCAAERQLPSLK
jgi:hypothetical protein